MGKGQCDYRRSADNDRPGGPAQLPDLEHLRIQGHRTALGHRNRRQTGHTSRRPRRPCMGQDGDYDTKLCEPHHPRRERRACRFRYYDEGSRGGSAYRRCLRGETAMTRLSLMILAGLLTASCDRSDYTINLKRTHIESVDRGGGKAYIVVDKGSAATMAKYGDVYVLGRTCPDDSCKTITVGTLRKYDPARLEGDVRLDLELWPDPEVDKDHPPLWLRNIGCFRIEAARGFMGRTGRSNWNCSIRQAARSFVSTPLHSTV